MGASQFKYDQEAVYDYPTGASNSEIGRNAEIKPGASNAKIPLLNWFYEMFI